jgi:hypothetical protein
LGAVTPANSLLSCVVIFPLSPNSLACSTRLSPALMTSWWNSSSASSKISSAFTPDASPPVSSSTTLLAFPLCSASAFAYKLRNLLDDVAVFFSLDILKLPPVSTYATSVPLNVSLCLVMSKLEISSLEFCPSAGSIRYSV